jgi:hypothetical protein
MGTLVLAERTSYSQHPTSLYDIVAQRFTADLAIENSTYRPFISRVYYLEIVSYEKNSCLFGVSDLWLRCAAI